MDIILAPKMETILPEPAPSTIPFTEIKVQKETTYEIQTEPPQKETVEELRVPRPEKHAPRAFYVHRVECRIHDMSLRLHETKHE